VSVSEGCASPLETDMPYSTGTVSPSQGLWGHCSVLYGSACLEGSVRAL